MTKSPVVQSQAAVLNPTEWDSWLSRRAQEWGTGEEMTRKHRFRHVQGCSELQTRTPENKVAHILEQMVLSCNHRWGGPTSQMLAEMGRGREEGGGRKGGKPNRSWVLSRCEWKHAYPPWFRGGNRCLSQTRERLKYSLMLSLGNKWFLHIPQVWVWISLGLQLRLISLHRLLSERTNHVCKKRAAWGPDRGSHPMVGDPLCSGIEWQWGMHAGFPTHVPSAPKQGGFQPFCLRCVVWGFNGWAQ